MAEKQIGRIVGAKMNVKDKNMKDQCWAPILKTLIAMNLWIFLIGWTYSCSKEKKIQKEEFQEAIKNVEYPFPDQSKFNISDIRVTTIFHRNREYDVIFTPNGYFIAIQVK